MRKYKILNFIFLAFIVFLLCITTEVKAYNNIDDDCLDKGTCILLCNYNNKNGSRNKTFTRNISLYYYLDSKEWKLYWEGSYVPNSTKYPNKFVIEEKGPSTLGHIFSNNGKNVYYSSEPKAKEFSCFEHAYLDYSNLLSFNELCFDNDGKTCKNDYNNIGTAFKANDYLSDEKDYDFEDDLNSYVSRWSFGDISCNDIYQGNADVDDSSFITNKLSNDLKTNYLHGHDVPDFIINSKPFKNAKENAKDALEAKITECTNQTNQEFENGDITEDEYNDRNDVLDNIDVDQAAENFGNAVNSIRENNASTGNWNQKIQCEDIFTDDPGSVGWMLNTIFNYIKIIGPILVVLLSSIDFIKAVVGTDEKAMKEAQSKLVVRLVAAVALFLIPTLVQLLLSFINQAYCSFM